MRTYEIYLHLDPSLGEGGADKALKDVEALLAKEGGTVLNKDNRGIMRLASPIGKNRDSVQVLLNIKAKPASIKEFRRQVNLLDFVLRIGIFTADEAVAA
jgi:ribosomal protein S6